MRSTRTQLRTYRAVALPRVHATVKNSIEMPCRTGLFSGETSTKFRQDGNNFLARDP